MKENGPFLISFKQVLIMLFLIGIFTFIFHRGKFIFANRSKHHKRILLVSHELSPTGAVRSLLDIRFGLERKGYQVDFVVLDQGYISINMLVKCSNVTTLVSPDKVYKSLLSYGVIVANTIASDSWIERQGLAYGQQFFERLIWYIRELPYDSVSRHLYSINSNKIRKNLFRRAKTVVFVSHASRNMYLDELGAINRKRLKVLHNPVDMKYFENILCGKSKKKLSDRLAIRSKLGILEDDMVVLIVGKFSKSKGSFDLIHSFEDWISESWQFRKTFHLIYVGEIESEWFEPLRTKLYMYMHRNLEIRVHAIGAVYSVDRMRKFYAGADIFILNSYCEAFGRVVLEAFATGVPVLAKNCGGPSEVIKNMTTGILYNTEFECMSLFSYMSSNKPFMQTMSMKSCEYVKEFHNPKQYIKEVERLILDHM